MEGSLYATEMRGNCEENMNKTSTRHQHNDNRFGLLLHNTFIV